MFWAKAKPALRPWVLAKFSGVISGNFIYVLVIFLQVPGNEILKEDSQPMEL